MSGTAVAPALWEEPGTGGGAPLVLGHSLGTSAALWSEAVPSLRERFRVFLWELPGHGGAEPATAAPTRRTGRLRPARPKRGATRNATQTPGNVA